MKIGIKIIESNPTLDWSDNIYSDTNKEVEVYVFLKSNNPEKDLKYDCKPYVSIPKNMKYITEQPENIEIIKDDNLEWNVIAILPGIFKYDTKDCKFDNSSNKVIEKFINDIGKLE